VKKYILLLILAVSVVAGCEFKPEKTNIGFIGTLSGRYSDLGQSTLQGVILAIENSENASRINLIVKDDFGKPAEGVKILSEMHRSGVKYIIGPSLSSVAAEIVPMLEADGLLILSPTVSTSDLAGKRDNFFRMMPHNNFKQAETISNYLINRLNIKSIVILYDSRNASYSNDIVVKFTEAYMRAGGNMMDVRPFNPDSGESLGAILEKDHGNEPDMYYVIGSAMDTSLIIWQIKKAGYKSGILIRKWAASDEFFRLGGDAVEGAMLFDFYIDKSTPAYTDFAAKYQKRFQKTPSWMSTYGYEAARMIENALPDLKAGESFYDALNESSDKTTLLKDFAFDEYGDASLPLNFFVIEHGDIVYKGPAE